jgi:hypothetical protein
MFIQLLRIEIDKKFQHNLHVTRVLTFNGYPQQHFYRRKELSRIFKDPIYCKATTQQKKPSKLNHGTAIN